MLYTELQLSLGWNNNKSGVDSNSLAEFPLKDILMTTIDVVRVSVGENFWEALSIF